MSDSGPDPMTPQTSGSAAPGTEGGTGGRPDDVFERGDDAGVERAQRAQRDRAESGIDNPLRGEGTTEEGRQQAVETATGPASPAGPGPMPPRGAAGGEPDPSAVSGD